MAEPWTREQVLDAAAEVEAWFTVAGKQRDGRLHGAMLRAYADLLAVPSPIDVFWREVERGWDIESREWFEANYHARGYSDPITMAVHHMWKRDRKAVAGVAQAQADMMCGCGHKLSRHSTTSNVCIVHGCECSQFVAAPSADQEPR